MHQNYLKFGDIGFGSKFCLCACLFELMLSSPVNRKCILTQPLSFFIVSFSM